MLLAEPLRQLDLLRKTSTHQHQSKVIEEQRTVLRRPSPGPERPVSDERVAPRLLQPTIDPCDFSQEHSVSEIHSWPPE